MEKRQAEDRQIAYDIFTETQRSVTPMVGDMLTRFFYEKAIFL